MGSPDRDRPVFLLGIGFLLIIAILAGMTYIIDRVATEPHRVKVEIQHEINDHATKRDQQEAVTAHEQAVSRALVCTGLEALPQTVGVKSLESLPYPIYLKPTAPFCPAPMPGATP